MQTNSYLEVKNYFANLVNQSIHLKSFAGFFSRDLFSLIDSYEGAQAPYLALYKYELGLEGPNENAIAVRQLGFAVVFNDVPADDYDKQYEAINNAEILANKIIARINWDNYQEGHFLYNAFLKDTVVITPIEGAVDSFGVDVQFSIRNIQSLKVDINDWKDIDKLC